MLYVMESGAVVDLTGEGLPSFSDAQELIGGTVEVLRLPRPYKGHRMMLVDEDGLPRRLPLNLTASEAYGAPVVGPALLLTFAESRRLL